MISIAYGLCILGLLVSAAIVIIGFAAKEKTFIVGGVCSTLIFVLVTGICSWFFSSTAAGARMTKDFKSSLHGLEREIIITAEDGREIYHYSGKCDIETQDKYILFEDENGKRQTIYWGALDTIIIQEK